MIFRAVTALGIATGLALATASPALAEPGHYGYGGTADEFPVGMCINITNGVSIDQDQLRNTIPVPCGGGDRAIRVVQHAAAPQDCTPPVYDTIWTTDGVVLCVVLDS